MVLKPEKEKQAEAIFKKWGLDFAIVGYTTPSKRFVVKHGGDVMADLPIKELRLQRTYVEQLSRLPCQFTHTLTPLTGHRQASRQGDALHLQQRPHRRQNTGQGGDTRAWTGQLIRHCQGFEHVAIGLGHHPRRLLKGQTARTQQMFTDGHQHLAHNGFISFMTAPRQAAGVRLWQKIVCAGPPACAGGWRPVPRHRARPQAPPGLRPARPVPGPRG